jgi:hypothetical protein
MHVAPHIESPLGQPLLAPPVPLGKGLDPPWSPVQPKAKNNVKRLAASAVRCIDFSPGSARSFALLTLGSDVPAPPEVRYLYNSIVPSSAQLSVR